MINFSINREYSIDEVVLVENFEEEYHNFSETHGTDAAEDFLLHMLEAYGPEEIGADEEYTETVVF